MDFGDTLQEQRSPCFLATPFPGKTRYTFRAARPLDKRPHLALCIACLPLGVVTLKSAQLGRDSVRFTVPKKALHCRTSDSHSIHATALKTQAAVVEEAR